MTTRTRLFDTVYKQLDENVALRICVIYALISSLWILFSDHLVFSFFSERTDAARISLIKEVVFVVVTSAIICRLINRGIRAIRESEESYRTLIETSPDAIVLLGLDTRVAMVNQRALSLTGYNRTEDVIGKSILHFVAPQDRERAAAAVRTLLNSGAFPNSEHVGLRKDGTTFPIELRASLVLNGGEKPKAMMVILRDISERKRAEEALRESELKFRSLAEESPNMIFINKGGRVVYANRKCEELTGYSREELCAPDFNFVTLIASESVALVKRNLARHTKGEEVPPYEYTILTKQGHRIAGIHTTKLINYEGGNAILGIITDITERKQAEQSLLEAEQKYRSIFEHAGEGIYQSTVEGRFVAANPMMARMLGYASEEELVSTLTNIEEQLYVDRNARSEFKRRLEEHGSIEAFESQLYRKDGSTIWVSENTRLVRNGSPETRYYEGTLQNITERKGAEEAMRESEQRHRSLFENMLDGYSYCKMLFDHDKPQDFIYVDVNNAFEQLTGLKNVVGKKVTEVIPGIKKSNPELFEIYARVALTGKPETFETYLESLGIWFSIAVYSPRKEYFVAVFDNITERKRAEEALRESEQRYRSLVEMSPDAIAVHSEGVFVFVNTAAVRLLGATCAKDLIGKPIMDFVHPDSREMVKERVRMIREEGTQAPLIEEKFMRLDGTVVDVEVAAIQFVYQGKPAIRVVVRDITGRNRAERELKLLAQTVASTKDCVSITDLEDRILFVNDAFVETYGYTRNELIGNPVSMVRSPLTAPGVGQQILPATLNGGWYGEIFNRRKDGSDFPVELWTSMVRDGHNEPVAMVGVARDITERKRAEEALRENEKRYRSIVENLTEAYYEADRHAAFTYCNPGLCLISGHTEGELLGTISFRLVAEEHRQNVMASYKRWIDEKRTDTSMEFFVQTKQGRKFWVEQITHCEFDSSGTFLKASNILRDIDERKRAEQALKESEMKFRGLIEQAADGVFMADPNGKLLLVNPKACEMLGYGEEELLRLHISDTYPPGEIDQAASRMQDVKSRGTVQFERNMRRKDGTIFQVEVSLQFLEDGTFQGIVRDITERKRAEEALKESERLLRESQVMAGLGSYALDITTGTWKSSVVLDDIFGIDAHFIHSVEGWASLIHPEHRESMVDYFTNEVIGKSTRFDKQYSIVRHSDGQERWVHGLGELEFDAQHRPIKMIGTIQDITERRRAEEETKNLELQFLQAQKMESVGTLAGGIAHDFNNILGIILGHATLLERISDDPAKFLKSRESIVTAVHRGASLVQQILTFARKTDVTFEPINVNDTVTELVKMLQETFPKTITFSLQLAPTVPFINGDRTQLHQTLLNLCVNARDAMPDGGSLAIGTHRASGTRLRMRFPDACDSEFICVSVSDTGTGMDEATRQRLFEPFFTTKPTGKGTGLGLAVVHGIMKSHHGHIDVESEMGKGTTFRLYFPVPRTNHATVETQQAMEDDVPGGSETVLLIEDEEALRELARGVLEARGYRVLLAADGEEAVQLYTEHRNEIAVVISDMGLPRMDGAGVFQRIKDINPAVKFILVSGYLEPEIKADLLKAGAKGFVQKPYTPLGILKQMRDVVERA